jgi:hypothetical protein
MTAAVRNGALPDEALQASSNHRLEPRERDEKERTFIIKPAFQNDGVEVGVPAEHVSQGLVGDEHGRTQWSARRFSVELIDDTVGEPRNSGKEASIVAKERA